ncbi:hypothetical protein KM043_013259 [Ampulex compressa]|nr:hypothetical protein KM043_013259 [Ampulex compressa]
MIPIATPYIGQPRGERKTKLGGEVGNYLGAGTAFIALTLHVRPVKYDAISAIGPARLSSAEFSFATGVPTLICNSIENGAQQKPHGYVTDPGTFRVLEGKKGKFENSRSWEIAFKAKKSKNTGCIIEMTTEKHCVNLFT